MVLFGKGVANVVEYPDLPPMRLKDKLDLESELLGVCISGHAVDAFSEGKDNGFMAFDKLKDDMDAEVFGLVKRFTKIVTKSGNDMAFMDISNKSGNLKVTIFPRDFEQMKEDVGKIREGDGVKLSGRFKENEEFGDAFIAKELLICQPVE